MGYTYNGLIRNQMEWEWMDGWEKINLIVLWTDRKERGKMALNFRKTRPIIIGFEPRNNTISRLRIKTNFYTTTVINVYVPTETADQERLDSFMPICPLCTTL